MLIAISQSQNSSLGDLFEVLEVRVGHGFWVFGIQGRFTSGIRYIAA